MQIIYWRVDLIFYPIKMIKSDIIPYELHFKQPAGTSRGVYTTRKVWYVKLSDVETGKTGIGECAPLPKLSCDDIPEYETVLRQHCLSLEVNGAIDYESLRPYPSILFGIETAMQNLNSCNNILWDTPFSRGEEGITINGLVWMGDFDEMYKRLEEKMKSGFKCIKLKIGAIDFDKELQLLSHIRKHFSPEEIEIRVDANGAFSHSDAMDKINTLSQFNIHSIEQPIRQGQWDMMKILCKKTPLSIALDEELIGINNMEDKKLLLDTINPQYIILKPSLHGGIHGSEEWIRLAEERNIGYWITSALESNIGLNAIAQWTATQNHNLPQGLGTGLLFTDNIESPLFIDGDKLWYDTRRDIEFKLK